MRRWRGYVARVGEHVHCRSHQLPPPPLSKLKLFPWELSLSLAIAVPFPLPPGHYAKQQARSAPPPPPLHTHHHHHHHTCTHNQTPHPRAGVPHAPVSGHSNGICRWGRPVPLPHPAGVSGWVGEWGWLRAAAGGGRVRIWAAARDKYDACQCRKQLLPAFKGVFRQSVQLCVGRYVSSICLSNAAAAQLLTARPPPLCTPLTCDAGRAGTCVRRRRGGSSSSWSWGWTTATGVAGMELLADWSCHCWSLRRWAVPSECCYIICCK